MAYFLLRHEGLLVGPSAALNVVGAVKAARALGPGHTVATVLCDGGRSYLSKLWSPAWMAEHGLVTGTLNRIGRMLTRGRPRVEPPVIGALHPAE